MYLGAGHTFRLRVNATATTAESIWYAGRKTKLSTGLGDLVATRGVTTGATTVNVVPSIPTGQQAELVYLHLTNMDSVSHTYTFAFFDGTNEGPPKAFVLQPGEVLEYADGAWYVYTAAGVLKPASALPTVLNDLQSVVLATNVVNNNATANTMADVTGLAFPVVSGELYWFRFDILYTAAATTTGSRWSISGPASPTRLVYTSEYSLAATTTTRNANNISYDLPAAANASSGEIGGNKAIIEGVVQSSSDGAVIARFASEISSSAITALAGSRVQWQRTL